MKCQAILLVKTYLLGIGTLSSIYFNWILGTDMLSSGFIGIQQSRTGHCPPALGHVPGAGMCLIKEGYLKGWRFGQAHCELHFASKFSHRAFSGLMSPSSNTNRYRSLGSVTEVVAEKQATQESTWRTATLASDLLVSQ